MRAWGGGRDLFTGKTQQLSVKSSINVTFGNMHEKESSMLVF